MNSAATIEISKSSLLSLKAEILRKQQEVNKAKLLQAQIQQTQTPLREKLKVNTSIEKNEPKNKGILERQAKDDEEDFDLMQKSRKMLESKARLYNRLVKGPASLTDHEIEMNKHYLVQFDRKEKVVTKESSDEEHFSDEYEVADDPDDEWVEYTDCLGRTRKCLRKDLEFLKGKDLVLSKTLRPDANVMNNDAPKWVIDKNPENINEDQEHPQVNQPFTSIPDISENNELFTCDMRRELLRQEWEKQEQDLMNKKDIHYQDILFNEARSHGVGYYAFSKDDETRLKQQEELRKLRQETSDKQKANLEQKATREKLQAARLKAARNRKRARMGLPPEEDEPVVAIPVEIPEVNEEDKQKAAEKESEEKAKEEARSKHIRDWDIGKEGVVPHYEFSQEEWNDKKRAERPTEFAPPSFYSHEKQIHNNDIEDVSVQNKSLFFTSKKSKEEKSKTKSINPYKNNSAENDYTSYQDSSESDKQYFADDCIDFDEEQRIESKKLDEKPSNFNEHIQNEQHFVDTQIKQSKEKHISRVRFSRNIDAYKSDSNSSDHDQNSEEKSSEQMLFADDYIDDEEIETVEKSKTFVSTPIVDECNIDYYEEIKNYVIKTKRTGTEIAPPPTFNYYGPTSSKQQKINVNPNLEDSISAGLRYLREKAEQKDKFCTRRYYDNN